MPKRIVIAGAGGFGRGVYGWMCSSPKHMAAVGIAEIVFIDDNARSATRHAPVISKIADYRPRRSDEIICAIGDPEVRQQVVTALEEVGANFHTFVDDRAVLGDRVQVSEGAIICPGTVISADVRIARHVHVNFNCSIGHDTVVGSFSTLSPSVNVMGGVEVGEAVFLGGSSVVLPRLRIESGATVGAGAVVLRNVSSGATLVGNPATQVTPSKDPK